MNIGEPQKIVYVEPLQFPTPTPREEPVAVPQPEQEPETVSAP